MLGRPPIAPDDFECRYRKACPHLFDRPALEARHATQDDERLERLYNQTVFFDHMRILITTAKRQGRAPLAFLQALLTDSPEAAEALLYRQAPDLDDSS